MSKKAICPDCEEPISPNDKAICGLCDSELHEDCMFGAPAGYGGERLCYPCAYGDGLTDETHKGQHDNEPGRDWLLTHITDEYGKKLESWRDSWRVPKATEGETK